jgi:hypothetical protein
MNRTPIKSLNAVARDSRVLEIERESGIGDSRYTYTATLTPGWSADGCHYLVGNTVAELLSTFNRRLTPCHCADCAHLPGTEAK